MKTYKAITLFNEFHGTKFVVRAQVVDGRACLFESQIRRARKALCGVKDCTCGDAAGTRPAMGYMGFYGVYFIDL